MKMLVLFLRPHNQATKLKAIHCRAEADPSHHTCVRMYTLLQGLLAVLNVLEYMPDVSPLLLKSSLALLCTHAAKLCF